MELRLLKAWVVSGPDKVPLTPTTGQAASVTEPLTWGSFDEACKAGYKHIGFVFSKLWPYAGVDLDKPDTPEQEARHQKICETFNTYQELSQSGAGVHLICRGSVPSGVRRDRVEVYSEGRYFIFTGNVLNEAPIADCQELLTILHAEMSATTKQTDLVEVADTITDDTLLAMARSATNQEKFNALWSGDQIGYPSQSEADFALIAMLAFYTVSNEQVRRLFRQSSLGERDKAQRNDYYLDVALGKIRGRQEANTLPPADISALLARYTEPVAAPIPVVIPDAVPPPAPVLTTGFPPGLLGEMAEYIYSSAIRPVREVGLTAALALGAGILGRHYNISATGLNQYIILLATTGTGKEGASGGIEALISAVRHQIPQADDFIGPGTFASGQALTRALDKSNCFVSVLGEIGLTLQQICDRRAGSHHVQLRKVLLDLYSKSGSNKSLRPSVYSDTEKNTGLVRAPCVTILGESTPGRFYDVLDNEHISEGLVPRFFVIEYNGGRPTPNLSAFHPPTVGLVARLVTAFQTVLAMKYNEQFCNVPLDASAKKMMDEYNAYADDRINAGDDELTKQLWNRAHLKALKLSGLVAVGCDLHRPVVTKEIAEWALTLASQDVWNMTSHFAKGDVGQGDHKCESDVKRAIDKYPSLTPKQRAAYNVPEVLRDRPQAVPFVYLKKFCAMRSAFRNDRRGAVVALEITLKDMLKAGLLSQIPSDQVKKELGLDSPLYFRGEAWQ